MTAQLTVTALEGLPLFAPGDDLVLAIYDGVLRTGQRLGNGDVLIIAQKVVSKVEGRLVDLTDVTPGSHALNLAPEVDKDPRLVELILSESTKIVRHKPGVLIVVHRLGMVMANAGIDTSNIDSNSERVLLLPLDPDATCRAIRDALAKQTGASVGVVINDSVGRAHRLGTVGIAIGAAGLPSLWDLRGYEDLFGRKLRISEAAVADELASAASLLQGQAAEARPVVWVRGLAIDAPERDASALVRPEVDDLFR
jgi:coenzyme F420-0:L-glutamate ligase/coenzyme F420-1:gamma-L-glutamate ligase